ncbi:MAG TPA: DUF4185 domain-containing protein [Kineosporiaceae bacterium]|nr:DUF4185 domain-containing protein [Kineosporiaceae bacterium]
MLQERTPARGLHVQPRAPQSGWNILVTALAVGLAVALAVLTAFGLRYWLKSDQPTTSARQATPPPTVPSAAAKSPTPAPGEPARPGQLAQGVQLWAGHPLGNIHQDQGSTIALPDGRTLWIFADTFQLYNAPKFFVTSSAAVVEPNSWQLHYSTTAGIPTEFLPRTPAERADQKSGDHYQAVWPTGSTTLPDGRIIISYDKYRVLVKEQDFQYLGAGLFEYRYRSSKALTHGGHATRIASDIWTADDGEMRSPVYADGYVYFQQCRDLRCQALRVASDQLAHRDAYRWWTGSAWASNRSLAQDIVVGSGYPGGNASVVRLKSGDYAMADTEVGAVGTAGQIWVAPDPWGPWSPAARFEFPRCPAPGCYGLNIHPSQSTDDRLRISYSTNGIGPFVRVVDVPVWISPDSSAIMVQ